jgi:preprotein translocase subunit SecD
VRKYWAYLIGSVALVVIALVATVAVGNEPVLGLDLQGGISVRLFPAGNPSESSLDTAKDIIDRRVNGLGVSDAEVTREGDNIVINLPGVKDRDKARRLVGRTAELRFRPVLAELPAAARDTPPADDATKAAVASCDASAIPNPQAIPNTAPADDKADACVVLPGRKQEEQAAVRYFLGPAALTGRETSGAKSEFQQGQGYGVTLSLKDSGRDKFNQLAQESFPRQPPQNSVAIVLDGVVQSAPRFNEPNFPGDVVISGNFTQGEADDLASVLKYGALPVRFDEKQQTVQSVSPTLGSDQLRSGVAAAVIGLVLVALYMLFFYRLLGVVVILGLLLGAGATYAVVAYLSNSGFNLTLSLAGVTGLIVSVGVTVDSYVVYFERLKDEVRTGKTVRSSVDRGFTRAFRTILAGDIVSLIGAGILYWLASGSVKGFAFFLGLSTLLDLGVTYFFMHPLVVILSRRRELVRVPVVGIASGLDAKEVTA